MYYYAPEQPNKLACSMICFVFVFIILIIAICWTNRENFENFANVLLHKKETMTSVLSGGKNYVSLSVNDNIIDKLKEKKTAVVAVLAPWCGYCKKLKSSGILNDIAKDFPVLVIDDKHPQTDDVMHLLQAEGFPAIGILNNGNIIPYRGDTKQLPSIMNSLKDNFSPTNKKELNNLIKKHKNLCIMFLAPWCGYCKRLKEERVIENLIDNGINVMVIDDNNPLTREMKVEGFPTIMCVKNGMIKKYTGERTAEGIIKYMK